MQLTSYQDVVQGLGTDLGHTDWVELPQDVVTAFADVTQDRQWIHVDERAAADGPFGHTIVHGFLLISLLPHFAEQWFDIQDAPMTINYGFDKIRFTSPVPVGARVRAHGEITGVEDRGDAAHATIRVELTAEGAERPAFVANWIYRVIAPSMTKEFSA